MLEECLKETYKNSYPDLKFTVYVTYPKYIGEGNAQSMIHVKVASDLSGEAGLQNEVINARASIIDCVNKKLLIYRESQPNNYDIVFGHDGTPINHALNVFDLDKSQFLETIESSLRNNVYGRLIARAGQVGKIVFYTTGTLKNITGKDMIELVQCICARYEDSSLKEFIDEQGKELIELIKDIIDKL